MKKSILITFFLVFSTTVFCQSYEQKSLNILLDTIQYLNIDISKNDLLINKGLSDTQTSVMDLLCFNNISYQSNNYLPYTDNTKEKLIVPRHLRYNLIRKIFKSSSYAIIEVFPRLESDELAFVSIKIRSSKMSGYNIIFEFNKNKKLVKICTNEWII